MLKVAALIVSCSTAAFVIGTGTTVHSPAQKALPFGASLKVTPDPSSVWSWSKEITAPANQTVTESVLVDFDGNGRMDTEHPFFRVLVTDMQCTVHNPRGVSKVFLRDATGVRWDMTPGSNNSGLINDSFALTTPLVLPVGSDLNVEVRGSSSGVTARVSLIGRIVNL